MRVETDEQQADVNLPSDSLPSDSGPVNPDSLARAMMRQCVLLVNLRADLQKVAVAIEGLPFALAAILGGLHR
jgi:hypothetical protein